MLTRRSSSERGSVYVIHDRSSDSCNEVSAEKDKLQRHFEVSHLHMSRDTVRLRMDRSVSRVVSTKGCSQAISSPVF